MEIVRIIYRKIKKFFLIFINTIAYINDFFHATTQKNTYRVKFTNFWKCDRNAQMTYPVYSALPEKKCISNWKPQIEIFSLISGKKEDITRSKAPVKIFYTGEDTEVRYPLFNDYCLELVDLALGYKWEDSFHNNTNYLRYPLWLFYYFGFCLDKDKIKEKVDWFNSRRNTNKRFCSLVASHDDNHSRIKMYEMLNDIGHINCPGRFLHNDDSLLKDFNDCKTDYLNQFMFNLCPENVSSPGYVTEKIFESYAAGCVPIYYGCNGNPEPYVLNKSSAIIYNGKNEESVINTVKELYSNPKLYDDFIKQPKLLDTAIDYIYERNVKLKGKYEEIINQKLK